MDTKPINIESLTQEGQNLAAGFITFQLDDGVEVTITERLDFNAFPPGGGFMLGRWGGNSIELSYPGSPINVAQRAIYKKDFTVPYLPWAFVMDGLKYLATKGVVDFKLQNGVDAVKGSYEFETEEGHKVKGTFDLKTG